MLFCKAKQPSSDIPHLQGLHDATPLYYNSLQLFWDVSATVTHVLERISNHNQASPPRALALLSITKEHHSKLSTSQHSYFCYSTCGLITQIFQTESLKILPQEHFPPAFSTRHVSHINQRVCPHEEAMSILCPSFRGTSSAALILVIYIHTFHLQTKIRQASKQVGSRFSYF